MIVQVALRVLHALRRRQTQEVPGPPARLAPLPGARFFFSHLTEGVLHRLPVSELVEPMTMAQVVLRAQ
jgi:hypothetical protein